MAPDRADETFAVPGGVRMIEDGTQAAVRRPPIGPVSAPALQVMTWNIRRRMRYGIRRADGWERRAPRLCETLRTEQPALLSTQECLPGQARVVREALGAGYRSVGRGRNPDGSGEGCPIFYDSARLEVLEAEQTALSDRPAVAGSRSWGGMFPRVMLTAAFRDRATSARFLVVSTHLDPLSQKSRVRSVQLIRRAVQDRSLPALVMGDFNAGVSSRTGRALFAGGLLQDAWTTAGVRSSADWGTFANYRAPRRGARRIDWIAASPDVQVRRVAVNARRYGGGWGSDHLPVQAEVVVPGYGEAR